MALGVQKIRPKPVLDGRDVTGRGGGKSRSRGEGGSPTSEVSSPSEGLSYVFETSNKKGGKPRPIKKVTSRKKFSVTSTKKKDRRREGRIFGGENGKGRCLIKKGVKKRNG